MSDVLGIDIGSYTIKIAVGKRKGENIEVTKLVSGYNPTGQFVPSDKGLRQSLAEAIKKILKDNNIAIKQVQTGLPESMAYTSVISMPNLSDAELASSIHWEAEQHIPVNLDEVNLEYSLLYRPPKNDPGGKMRVLIVGARKDVVNDMIDLFNAIGLETASIETTVLSLYRVFHPAVSQVDAAMICHIGALTTDMVVTYQSELMLTYSVQMGGLAFTRAIEKGLELAPAQAEEYKRAYGLDSTQLQGKLRQVLSPVVNVLIAEMRKAIQFYQSTHTTAPLRTILISGGSAYLPGLISLLSETFGIDVVLANPLEYTSKAGSLTIPGDVSAFAPVIGYAMHQ